MSCQIYKISVFKLADFSHRSCLYRVSHPFVDNFWLNFLFIKTTYWKSKICFKIFVKKSFRWQIEYQKNVSNSKKKFAPCLNPPRHGAIFFLNLTHFFDIQLKKTSHLIFLDFKVPSERFFSQKFQNILSNMWF